jgi:hypothetical protein
VRHSTPPLGRSTHQDRIRQRHDEEEALGRDLDKLPASPSPMKKVLPSSAPREEGLIPPFNLMPCEQPHHSIFSVPLTSYNFLDS